MDWLQFCLAMMMAFVGLESISSGLRLDVRERSWMALLAFIWLLAAACVAVSRMLERWEPREISNLPFFH